jgi:CheY-like chemotaxis protein
MERPRPEETIADLTGQVVVIIDDDDDCRELLATLLEGRNARVIQAGSASEGLAQVREQRPTVVVSDIAMPGEDGYSFARRLRALPGEQGGSVPAIALSAFNQPRDRDAALAAGFSKHLAKPIDMSDLCAQIRRLASGRPLDFAEQLAQLA